MLLCGYSSAGTWSSHIKTVQPRPNSIWLHQAPARLFPYGWIRLQPASCHVAGSHPGSIQPCRKSTQSLPHEAGLPTGDSALWGLETWWWRSGSNVSWHCFSTTKLLDLWRDAQLDYMALQAGSSQPNGRLSIPLTGGITWRNCSKNHLPSRPVSNEFSALTVSLILGVHFQGQHVLSYRDKNLAPFPHS